MIKALKDTRILKLWYGQAFSSVGDEIYRVGLTWFVVGLMGANTGYLTAGQTASLMLLSFVGGKWADRWNPMSTMINVDIIRAFIVLIPVIISFFKPVPLFILWAMALSLSGLSAFFYPASQAVIPIIAPDAELMKSTNGLMSTTIRMARMVGPAVVGLLAAFIPMVHFFTIDAVTFFVSAYSVYLLNKTITKKDFAFIKQNEKISFKEAINGGYDLVKKRPGMRYVFYTKAITAGSWNLALMIGFALLVHEVTNGDARSFGLVMATYGIGNFIGALYFGNIHRVRLWAMLFWGYVLMGVGFILMGMAPTVNLIMLTAGLTGFAGPMNDLALIDMFQHNFEVSDLTKIFRLRTTFETAGTLFFTTLSPWLIKSTSIRAVIILSGILWLLSGFGGLFFPPDDRLKSI